MRRSKFKNQILCEFGGNWWEIILKQGKQLTGTRKPAHAPARERRKPLFCDEFNLNRYSIGDGFAVAQDVFAASALLNHQLIN